MIDSRRMSSRPIHRGRLPTTALTERGQTSVPVALRRAMGLVPGQRLEWEQVSEREMRVRIADEPIEPDPFAAIGFSKRFRDWQLTTEEWMRLTREGEEE